MRRVAATEPEQEPYQPITAQAPYTPEMSPQLTAEERSN